MTLGAFDISAVTLGDVLLVVLAVALALDKILGAVGKLRAARDAAHAPDREQDKRLAEVEHRLDEIDRKLLSDDRRINDVAAGAHVTQRAILALLSHGIDGNNIKQMHDAKAELEQYLTER